MIVSVEFMVGEVKTFVEFMIGEVKTFVEFSHLLLIARKIENNKMKY